MIKLLHTADWQIGKLFGQFEPGEAALLAEARYAVIERLAQLIAAARRPLLIAGGGVVRSDATQQLRALLEATGMPASVTPQARGSARKPAALDRATSR